MKREVERPVYGALLSRAGMYTRHAHLQLQSKGSAGIVSDRDGEVCLSSISIVRRGCARRTKKIRGIAPTNFACFREVILSNPEDGRVLAQQ